MRRLCMVGLLALCGATFASNIDIPLGTIYETNLGDQFMRTRSGWSLTNGQLTIPDQARHLAGNGTVTKNVKTVAGRIGGVAMSWKGNVALLGVSLIPAALQYFYEQAQQATGTPLDDWYNSGATADYNIPAPTFQNQAGVWDGTGGGCTSCNVQPDNPSAIWNAIKTIPGASQTDTIHPRMKVGSWVSDNGIQYYAQGAHMYNGSTAMGFSYGGGDCATGYVTVAKAEACTAQVLYDWLNATHSSYSYSVGDLGGGTGPNYSTLPAHLDANPTSKDALGNVVVPEWMDDRTQNGDPANGWSSWPYTRQEPYGPGSGVTLDPVPNVNEWTGNPWADPSLDSDGDGYKDWEEVVSGTDPNDATSAPTTAPVPDSPTDVDGDGVPDEFDPCPNDATNMCALDLSELATESTLQGVRTDLQGIRDALNADPAAAPSSPTFGAWAHLPIAADAWASVETRVQTRVDDFKATVGPKVPFVTAPWVDAVTFTSDATCGAIPLSILGTSHDVGLCQTPVHDFLSGTGRAVLLAAMVFGFYLSAAWAMTEQ